LIQKIRSTFGNISRDFVEKMQSRFSILVCISLNLNFMICLKKNAINM